MVYLISNGYLWILIRCHSHWFSVQVETPNHSQCCMANQPPYSKGDPSIYRIITGRSINTSSIVASLVMMRHHHLIRPIDNLLGAHWWSSGRFPITFRAPRRLIFTDRSKEIQQYPMEIVFWAQFLPRRAFQMKVLLIDDSYHHITITIYSYRHIVII